MAWVGNNIFMFTDSNETVRVMLTFTTVGMSMCACVCLCVCVCDVKKWRKKKLQAEGKDDPLYNYALHKAIIINNWRSVPPDFMKHAHAVLFQRII